MVVMKVRIFALILALLMVVPFLVSCKDDGGDIAGVQGSKETSEDTSNETEENRYAHVDEYIDDLAAQYNYDGVTFTMIDNGTSFPEEDEITGILEDDALYSRYRELEEKFGIEMNKLLRTEEGTDFEYSGQAIADDVKRDVMAGGASYDLICGGVLSCGQNMVNNGVIRPANDVPGFDFKKSWWIRDGEEKLGIAGNLYFLTGKIVVSHYKTPSLIAYSKKIAEDFNITEDLYKVVEDGDWTVDKMFRVAEAVPVNTTGQGIYRYVTSGALDGFAFYQGAGFTLTQKDEEGKPLVASALTSEQMNYIDKMAAIFGDKTQNFDVDTYAKENGYDDPESEHIIFAEERFLFCPYGMGGLIDLRDEDMSFGILPMPKSSPDQKNYYSFSSGWTMYAVYLSQNLKDEEMSGVITEAMAALSEKHVEPAYYEKALKGRSTYDVDSRRMLDIIYAGEVVDLTEIYMWSKLADTIGEAVEGTEDNVVSSYNVSAKLVNNSIRSLVRKIEKQNSKG